MNTEEKELLQAIYNVLPEGELGVDTEVILREMRTILYTKPKYIAIQKGATDYARQGLDELREEVNRLDVETARKFKEVTGMYDGVLLYEDTPEHLVRYKAALREVRQALKNLLHGYLADI